MQFLEGKLGKWTVIVAAILGLGLAYWALKGYFGKSAVAQEANVRWFICSKTGKAFQQELKPGMDIPILSPYSGEKTGYLAEKCFWTKDGGVKSEPTYVLLKSYLGDPSPTFCPDCGRLVVGHNPPAEEGRKPPPTKEEWEQTHGGGGGEP